MKYRLRKVDAGRETEASTTKMTYLSASTTFESLSRRSSSWVVPTLSFHAERLTMCPFRPRVKYLRIVLGI